MSFQTAISYICSNGLVQFLDILLQLPNIDVNKADNEGNTPLHFAAEAGESLIYLLMNETLFPPSFSLQVALTSLI